MKVLRIHGILEKNIEKDQQFMLICMCFSWQVGLVNHFTRLFEAFTLAHASPCPVLRSGLAQPVEIVLGIDQPQGVQPGVDPSFERWQPRADPFCMEQSRFLKQTLRLPCGTHVCSFRRQPATQNTWQLVFPVSAISYACSVSACLSYRRG